MARELVPTFQQIDRLPYSRELSQPLGPGQFQAVHFTVPEDQLDFFLEKIEQWFADRDEVILIANGNTWQENGYIVLEWEECEIDPLFLKILEHDDNVLEASVYVRYAEVE